MAEASGVNAPFVHYLLILLVTLMIVVGVRVAGSILVTALLVLPGATAALLTSKLRATTLLSVASAVVAAAVALLLRARWDFLLTGPSIVLAMFVQFLIAYSLRGLGGTKVARASLPVSEVVGARTRAGMPVPHEDTGKDARAT
jgi:ABC-type Mn2+/Zn2+ transport system permease subunit